MARLKNEDWLHHAKSVAVGQEKRVRHGNESTPAMTVGNRDDRWWAYCQRCKIGAVELKSHVLLVDREPPKSRDLSLPYDMKPIEALPEWQRNFLAKFLASKGMDLTYLPSGISWSEERARLLVPSGMDFRTGPGYNGNGGQWVVTGWMGRDTSGKSPQKWLTYNGQHFVGERNQTPMALLFEDMFSFYKVQWAVASHGALQGNVTCYCTLGTAIHDSLFIRLLQDHRKVASFYDGDQAGLAGATRNARRLTAAGILSPFDAVEQCAPFGVDPKDMSIFDIQQHVAKLYGG